jgi:2-dehydropantoate 2-reductase
MRYVVFGAGGVGGVVGGRLFEHGHDVVLIARGPHADAMRRAGLRLESPAGVSVLPVPVVTSPRELDWGPDEMVLLAMKSQDTLPALTALASVAPAATPVACLQNGVENERAALRLFSTVYAVCVICPGTHLEPGVVVVHSAPTSGVCDLGRYPAGVDQGAEELAGALCESTFSSETKPDIMRWKYAKLLVNLVNAVDALCGRGLQASQIVERARAEGQQCLRAAGIDFATEEEDRARRGDLLKMRPVEGQRRAGSSTWQSLARGTGSIESDYLNGEVVLLGRLLGIPTPVNATLQRCVAEAARRGAAPGSMTEEELLERIAAEADAGSTSAGDATGG